MLVSRPLPSFPLLLLGAEQAEVPDLDRVMKEAAGCFAAGRQKILGCHAEGVKTKG